MNARQLSLARLGKAGILLPLVVLLSLSSSAGHRGWRVPPSGNHYYANSTFGSDRNPGTSPFWPWRTLAPLRAHRLLPGDVVNLARGSSWDGGLVIGDSGLPGRPITFQAYGIGKRPVLRNSGVRTRAVTVDASWVVLDGLAVQGAHECGIYVSESAEHNIIQGCEATLVGIGFGVAGRYNLVTRSIAHDLTMIVNTPGGDDDYGAVGVALFGSWNEVSYNQMERCRAPSHDYGTDGGAVELYGHVSGNYIHHNRASRNCGFIEVGGGSAEDTVVAFNLSLDNEVFTVIHLRGRFASVVRNLCVDNNTIVETGTGHAVLIFEGEPTGDALLLRNNVIYVNRFQSVANSARFTHANNLFSLAQGGTQLGFDLGPEDKLADPLFVDLDGGDLRLRPGSPAIRSGMPLRYDSGHPALPTPDGADPDAGAYERGGD